MMKIWQSAPSPARARTFVLGALTAFALLGAAPLAPATAQPAASAATALAWQHRGFTIASYAENDLYDSGAALQQLADAGANSVTFAVTWYTPHQYSTDIYRTGSTATNGALIWAVERAKSLGLRVILKPHLDSQDGAWRAFINPSDADRWFANYAAMLNGYADLGRLHGAEGLCVGAELIAMSTNPAYDARWRALIAGVRSRFAGTLTYSANWGGEGFGEEYPKVPFWDALDVLGISAYFELADTNAPTVAQLRARWDGWRANKIAPFQARWNKPLMFIEGGYRSVDGAARQPWNSDAPGPADRQEQADLYEALFQTWATVPWFHGSAFWYWSPNASVDANGTGYEVQNKTALATVAAWFKGGGVTPSPAPTGQLVVAGPLTLDRTVVGPGQTLTGRVTYRNVGTAPVGVGEIVITARPPGGTNAGGPYLDFSPRQGAVTVAPGAAIVVTASRQFAASDPSGAWYAFATYRDTAGVYRDAPGPQPFTVSATPPPTPTTAPPPPPPTPTPTTTPPPTSSPAQATRALTVATTGVGSVTPGGVYATGGTATLTALPAAGSIFTGWTVDGRFQGWANPLTLTMAIDHTVAAGFAPAVAFADVPAGQAYSPAIAELAARGYIQGYGDGTYGPSDRMLRAQMAALIARAMGYGDAPTNPFTDRCAPGGGDCVDDELWKRVAELAARNIAKGYTDAGTCGASGVPCYAPRDFVLHAQVLSFIARAMVEKGYWAQQPIDAGLYGGVLDGTGHEQDVATYAFYTAGAGGVPDYPASGGFAAWDRPATRGWFARALWTALDSYLKVDRTP